jgi:hypothetical protein
VTSGSRNHYYRFLGRGKRKNLGISCKCVFFYFARFVLLLAVAVGYARLIEALYP